MAQTIRMIHWETGLRDLGERELIWIRRRICRLRAARKNGFVLKIAPGTAFLLYIQEIQGVRSSHWETKLND